MDAERGMLVEIHFQRASNFFYENPISQRTNQEPPPPGPGPPARAAARRRRSIRSKGDPQKVERRNELNGVVSLSIE
jgi:hypothetical protein